MGGGGGREREESKLNNTASGNKCDIEPLQWSERTTILLPVKDSGKAVRALAASPAAMCV